MTFRNVFSAALLIVSATTNVLAADADFSNLPEKKRTKLGLYMTAQQANEFVSNNSNQTLFVDVRTRAEVNFLGTANNIDANVPYMELNEWYAWNDKADTFKLDVNSDFASSIAKRLEEKHLTKNDAIVIMCRSGDRSAKAADLLADLGYSKVYSIVDGYEGDQSKDPQMEGKRVVNGWKNAGLPWSYKLAKNKMYFTAEQ